MEIGAKLKEAREAKNLTLEDIQKITKIQTRYLQAIEKGKMDIMPGNFYVRAFIKEYALAVDLDPDELFEEHKDELPAIQDESAISYSRVQRSRKESATTRSPAILSFLPTVIVILLIIGILFMVWYFKQDTNIFNDDGQTQSIEEETENGTDQVKLPDEEDAEGNNNEDENDPALEEEENITSDQDQDEDNSEAPNEQIDSDQVESDDPAEPGLELVEYENEESTYEFYNTDEELTLELTTTGENWLEIENGKGKSFYYNLLTGDNSPEEIDMTGEDQIYLKFGNPSSITIKINDQPLELSDEITPTEVQNVWINIKTDA
ncbi:RodZ domain-containing protein [Aquibacillus sediminis]|uniref:RodZ domain-containing protein n=1 Tax=Aquibacillus sediminis TaxID=2574734 RepID=UPI001486C86B|nr:RodZ domain-containing protein [Aquibacillus sediminis]